MNAGFMGEGVAADYRLIRRGREADHRCEKLAYGVEAVEHDVAFDGILVGAHMQDGGNLSERSVAGALADSVDGALDLATPCLDSGQSVRNRQSEIVMA